MVERKKPLTKRASPLEKKARALREDLGEETKRHSAVRFPQDKSAIVQRYSNVTGMV